MCLRCLPPGYTLRYYKNRATNYAAELDYHSDPFAHNVCENSDGTEMEECVP